MAIMPIRTIGDPVLRTEAKKIETVTDEIRELAESMVETMETARGVGLAAPQVGESVSLIIVPSSNDVEEASPVAVLNPVLSHVEGSEVGEEGCLSIPGFSENVKRAVRCVLSGQDLEGRKLEIEAEDLLARVFQHEIDHLAGVLYVDRLSPLKRQILLRQIERSLKEQE